MLLLQVHGINWEQKSSTIKIIDIVIAIRLNLIV